MRLFATRPLLVGVVHLRPLPGSPRGADSMDAVLRRALADARALVRGGMGALIVENYGDVPFYPGPLPPETVAAMALAVARVRSEVRVPVGVNCLRNDARAAVGVAAVAGAAFVRVNQHVGIAAAGEGFLVGEAHATLRERARLRCGAQIFADVLVKHAAPIGSCDLAAVARDTAYRGLADALVVTGPATGEAVDPEHLRMVRAAVPDRPLLAGSGVNPANARNLLAVADGAIVGTSLERGGVAGNPVDLARVRAFVAAARAR